MTKPKNEPKAKIGEHTIELREGGVVQRNTNVAFGKTPECIISRLKSPRPINGRRIYYAFNGKHAVMIEKSSNLTVEDVETAKRNIQAQDASDARALAERAAFLKDRTWASIMTAKEAVASAIDSSTFYLARRKIDAAMARSGELRAVERKIRAAVLDSKRNYNTWFSSWTYAAPRMIYVDGKEVMVDRTVDVSGRARVKNV